MRAGLISALAAGAALSALPAVAPGYRSGPPAAHTGGFGEPSCDGCHMGPAATAQDALVLEAPVRYTPGERYDIRVRLADPGLAAAGFQLAVRFADAPAAGRQAGTLSPVDSTVTVITSAAGVEYASQTSAGSRPAGAAGAAWLIHWTAPPEGAAVVFHVAANAADDDDSPLGDRIHRLAQRVERR